MMSKFSIARRKERRISGVALIWLNNTTVNDLIRTLTRAAATIIFASSIAVSAMAASASEIESELSRSSLVVDNLSVEEVEGIMIVSGRAAELAVVREIEAFIRSRSNRPVISAIEIIEKPDDAIVERRVERALHLNENLADASISIAIANGVIELTGTVENELQIRAAEDTVRTVREVLAVRNLLRVRS